MGEGRALDLIEMDAASNRGIDEIRSLRDKVNFSPTSSRYKVYLIDEVHELTQSEPRMQVDGRATVKRKRHASGAAEAIDPE